MAELLVTSTGSDRWQGYWLLVHERQVAVLLATSTVSD